MVQAIKSIPHYNERRVRELLTTIIITDGMPFLTNEGKRFHNFVVNLEPRFLIPSQYMVMRDCLNMHATEKVHMKDMFMSTRQRVSSTVVTWTSIQT